jgi:hypothetical protein
MTKPSSPKRRKVNKEGCYKPNHPFSIGSSLIFHTRYVELDEQVRAIDAEHVHVVEQLSRGRGISLCDLQKYKILSPSDFEDPKNGWYEAPIIVPINRDRFSLIHETTKRFAECRGTIVLRWRSRHSHFRQKPPDIYLQELFEDPCFYEYFVIGAKASFHSTINRKLGLVNALPVILHSLTMQNDADLHFLKNAILDTPVGEICTIPKPLSINVAIDVSNFTPDQLDILKRNSIHAEDPNERNIRIFTGRLNGLNNPTAAPFQQTFPQLLYSDSDDDEEPYNEVSNNPEVEYLIIPIMEGGSKRRERVQVNGRRGRFNPCRVTIKQHFPIDLGFVITVNRSQGQTLGKVILAISQRSCKQCNFKYAGIYVAFSRVKQREDIRLLLVGNTQAEKWGSVTYIQNLRPGPSFFLLFAGFPKEGRMVG